MRYPRELTRKAKAWVGEVKDQIDDCGTVSAAQAVLGLEEIIEYAEMVLECARDDAQTERDERKAKRQAAARGVL